MAGLLGNQAYLGFQKQLKRGTAAVPAAYTAHKTTGFKTPLSGGAIGPVREVEQLAETDSNRDQGISYVKSSGVKGNPQVYVRDENIGALALYGLGLDEVTEPSAGNFLHTVRCSNALPYVTFWYGLGETLYEQYKDCLVSSLEFKATAGSPLTCDVNILGLEAERQTLDTLGGKNVPLQSGFVYNYNNADVKLSGGATALVQSMTVTIDNNLTLQQTDNVIPYDVAVGKRTVTCSFDLIFESLTEYEKFQYESASGYTKVSSSIYTTSLSYNYTNGSNNAIEFTLPTLAYEEFPLQPEVGGGPVVATIKGVAQRPTSGSILTVAVKNQQETY